MTKHHAEHHHDHRTFELVSCPECGNVATIEWESRIAGALYVKLHCINRHWFLMPADTIACFGSDRPHRGSLHNDDTATGPG
jgi:hypothetical protein